MNRLGAISLSSLNTVRRFLTATLFLGCASVSFAQVSFSSAISLALRNSNTVRLAQADVDKASGALQESKAVYIPSFVLGSGLGYSYGFPVGQPSIYNVTSQSLVFNAGQISYIHSAESAVTSSQMALKDARQQIILDTALAYLRLNTVNENLKALAEESTFVEKLVSIEQERLDAGMESRTEFTQARLTAAQIRLKRIHLESEKTQLQYKLSHLTALPAAEVIPVQDSIPSMPEFPAGADLAAEVPRFNASVLAAKALESSKNFAAKGDRLQNLRPQIAFAAQYNRYAKYNNYDLYYRNFQHNNFGIGVEISLPLFDASRKAKARQSATEALRAKLQAAEALQQNQQAVITLQTSLRELRAQAEVASLKNELAQDQLNSVLTQLENGGLSTAASPLTPKHEQLARIEERQRYEESLDAAYDLVKTQLTLLRTLGTIEDWAKIDPAK